MKRGVQKGWGVWWSSPSRKFFKSFFKFECLKWSILAEITAKSAIYSHFSANIPPVVLRAPPPRRKPCILHRPYQFLIHNANKLVATISHLYILHRPYQFVIHNANKLVATISLYQISRFIRTLLPLLNVRIPYIPVYNAMFFLSYSCRKKEPRIIHRGRI